MSGVWPPWKRVWITGASTGIGAEVARQLAGDGVVVAISARNGEQLQEAAERNENLRPFPLDVTDATAVADTFARIEWDLGPVDLVICSAGTYAPVSLSRFATTQPAEPAPTIT